MAGDQLVEDGYELVPIEELDGGVLQGYSAALDLNLRWEHGQLGWYDPATGRHIPTYEDQLARAEAAEAQLRAEQEARAAD